MKNYFAPSQDQNHHQQRKIYLSMYIIYMFMNRETGTKKMMRGTTNKKTLMKLYNIIFIFFYFGYISCKSLLLEVKWSVWDLRRRYVFWWYFWKLFFLLFVGFPAGVFFPNGNEKSDYYENLICFFLYFLVFFFPCLNSSTNYRQSFKRCA